MFNSETLHARQEAWLQQKGILAEPISWPKVMAGDSADSNAGPATAEPQKRAADTAAQARQEGGNMQGEHW